MQKDKLTNTNTVSDHVTKIDKTPQEWEEYLNTATLQMCPANNGFKERFFLGMFEYISKNDKCYTLEEYIDLQGIGLATHNRWMKEDPRYKEINERCKRIIGRRLQKIVIEERLGTSSYLAWILPHYSKSDEIEHTRRATLKSENESTSITVNMQPAPVTGRFSKKDAIEGKEVDAKDVQKDI